MSISRNTRSTTKIWLVFIIILIMVGAAVFWSYRSYKELTDSINQLSSPDDKTALIQSTVQSITKAENYIQSYILTNETETYSLYKQEINNVQLSIDKLRDRMAEDSLQIQRVDSLEILFLQKLTYLSDFLVEKQKNQRKNFSSEALEKIESSTADSTATDAKVLTKLKTIEKAKPKIVKDLVEKEYKAKGVWEGIKRIFGSKNIRVDTVYRLENDTVRSMEVVIDTLHFTNYNPDTVLLKVKNILQEVANQEFRSQYILSAKELNLLRQDIKLRAEIDRLINQLQEAEGLKDLKRKEEIYAVTSSSSKAVLAFGIAGIVLGGIFLFAIGRDLTKSHYLSKRLELEKNKANHLAKVKEEFLANMSHEIRTPLNSIFGFSELMKKTQLDETQKQYTHALSENTTFLISLVNDILDFSKLESNKVDLVSEPFYMPQLLADMESLFSLQCADKGLDFKIRYDEDLREIDLIGDEFRLKQILTNLLGNALKFTKEGEISVDIKSINKHNRQELTIKVHDTGKGIAPSKFKTIFNSFEQEDASVTKEYGGTGLGLAIVKKLVDAMHGKIMVDSQLDSYTTFTLKIALPFTEHILEEKTSVQLEGKLFFDIHLIIIDDDTWNHKLLKSMLSKKVRRLSLFEDGHQALALIQNHPAEVDVVMTDINMPQISGLKVLEKIRQNFPEIAVIALTAHALPQKIKAFKNEGFKDIIIKPIKESRIDQVLSETLPSEKTSIIEAIPNDKTFDFNFEHIKEFTGDDNELLTDLIGELVIHNHANVELFKQHFNQENKVLLSNLAHKMIHTYDSINLTSIAEALKSIEVYHTLGKHEAMFTISKDLIPLLEEVDEELQNIKPQSYI